MSFTQIREAIEESRVATAISVGPASSRLSIHLFLDSLGMAVDRKHQSIVDSRLQPPLPCSRLTLAVTVYEPQSLWSSRTHMRLCSLGNSDISTHLQCVDYFASEQDISRMALPWWRRLDEHASLVKMAMSVEDPLRCHSRSYEKQLRRPSTSDGTGRHLCQQLRSLRSMMGGFCMSIDSAVALSPTSLFNGHLPESFME